MAAVDEGEVKWWGEDALSPIALLRLPHGDCSKKVSACFAVRIPTGNAYMSDAKGCSVVYKYLHTTQVV